MVAAVRCRTAHGAAGGLARFIAVSLLSGYAWLALGGVLWALFGDAEAGVRYDAILHAVFLGFVFAMAFAHAPVILPTVLGGAIHYGPSFYAHPELFNLSLAVRLAGDVVDWAAVRAWGGLLGVAAILLFLVTSTRGARQGRSRHASPRTPSQTGE